MAGRARTRRKNACRMQVSSHSPVIQPGSTAKGVDMFATIRTNSTPRGAAFSILAVFLTLAATTDVARAQDGLIGWGLTVIDSRLPQSFVEVAAGEAHTVARRSDGSVVAWGLNGKCQCNVPAWTRGVSYVQVAAGLWHSAALRIDGGMVARGLNGNGQCNVPALPPGLSYVEVAAGGGSSASGHTV